MVQAFYDRKTNKLWVSGIYTYGCISDCCGRIIQSNIYPGDQENIKEEKIKKALELCGYEVPGGFKSEDSKLSTTIFIKSSAYK